MIVLDTNVVSALMLERPDPQVLAWLDTEPADEIWTTTISVFELRFGIERLPAGRRRNRLDLELARLLQDDLQGRILPFDVDAAREAGRIAAQRERRGATVEFRDTQIAGIAVARQARIATRNARHFRDLGLPVIDPWSAGARPA